MEKNTESDDEDDETDQSESENDESAFNNEKADTTALNEKKKIEEPDSPDHDSPSYTTPKVYTSPEISRGGRCPITGKKLLGCKWNELKGEFDVDGVRRLIF